MIFVLLELSVKEALGMVADAFVWDGVCLCLAKRTG